MDSQVKKSVLRMIPYGLYVLTSESKDGNIAAATINWVTQASFEPPLIAIGVKADSGAHEIIKESKVFALNYLKRVIKIWHIRFLKHWNEMAIQ